ncbi:flagellin FliC, partial [Escherichia coli]
TDVNGDALYNGSDGNLTKNQAGGPEPATMDGIFNGANGHAAVDAKITFGSGMTVEFTQVSKIVEITGATVSAEDLDTALTGQ